MLHTFSFLNYNEAASYIASREETWYNNGLLPWILVGALLATVLVIYLVSAIRSRGKPKVERKGAGLLGSYGGMGAAGGKPTGAGAMGGVPGMTALYGKKSPSDPPEAPEDPRKR
ncbi:MAG: hypothetical protein ACI4XW_01540 [Candidatus Spyradocola sp.]